MTPAGAPEPGPDVSVRIAWADDADAIGRVQQAAWQDLYADLLPAAALEGDSEAVAAAWREALRHPGDARNRVLVALEHTTVTGIAVTSPSPDPDRDSVADGEVAELLVDPGARGRGHASRLLQAVADTLVADKFTRATFWINARDDALRQFFESAGWEADGAHRELDLDGTGAVQVRQVRLHTALE